MKQEIRNRLHAITLTIALPIVFAIGGHASADEFSTKADGNVVEKGKWDWQINPQAYQPDGLTDYNENSTAASQLHATSDKADEKGLDLTVAGRSLLVQPR